VKAGKQPKMQPENARQASRRPQGSAQLPPEGPPGQLQIASNPPVIAGCALILPQGLIDQYENKPPEPENDAEVRKKVELMAMRAVARRRDGAR